MTHSYFQRADSSVHTHPGGWYAAGGCLPQQTCSVLTLCFPRSSISVRFHLSTCLLSGCDGVIFFTVELSFAYHGEDGAVPTLAIVVSGFWGDWCVFFTFPLSSVLNTAVLDVPHRLSGCSAYSQMTLASSPSVFLQISASLCPGPVSGTGSSVVTADRCLPSEAWCVWRTFCSSFGTFPVAYSFYLVLCCPSTQRLPYSQYCIFIPKYNLGFMLASRVILLKQANWLQNPWPVDVNDDLLGLTVFWWSHYHEYFSSRL